MTIEFARGGRFRSHVELERKEGAYKVGGGIVTIEIGGESRDQGMRIEKGYLILKEGGSEDRFKRVR